MPDNQRQEIRRMNENLVEMTQLVQRAMSSATQALLTADRSLAETVISDDLAIDNINNTIEISCLAVLSAGGLEDFDVRATVGALRMSTTLERMGDLAAHVAKQARLRYPFPSVPDELRTTFARMGDLANAMVERTAAVLDTNDLSVAADMAAADAEMDSIHRELFAIVLSPDWKHGVESAIDVTLLSRFYERFADHGLTIAKRVAFIQTGRPYGVNDIEGLE